MDLLTANDPEGAYPRSWYAATADLLPPFPRLEGSHRADVAIVGGGYSGLSAALHLAEAGASVALLEAHRVGWGASGRNGGQLGSGQRQDQLWLEDRLGRDRARALWALGEEAKATVRGLIARHAIVCDLRDGIALVAHKRALVPAYHRYAEALARDYAYDLVEPLDAGRTAELLGTDTLFGGLLDRGTAHLHPLRYALGLARAAEAAGARLYERSRVLRLDGHQLATASGRLRADRVVLATNGYLGELVPEVAARVMPINNFMIATEPLAEPPVPSGIAAADSRFVVNYWRPTPDNRLLFGGGESYGYRFPADIEGLVRRALARVYPRLAAARVSHVWGGTLGITVNRMPAFQRVRPGLYSIAGYSGHGVGAATLAGRLVAEALSGSDARFDLLAGIPQKRFPGGARLRWPLLVLAMSWYALRDRL